MIPNFAQSVEEIIRCSTPEQKILWQNARLIAGEQAAVRQLYYCGATANADLNTYVAGKFFVCYSLIFSHSGGNLASVTGMKTIIFDHLNAQCLQAISAVPVWNTTTAAHNYTNPSTELKNFIFGRFEVGDFNFCRFIGYKIS